MFLKLGNMYFAMSEIEIIQMSEDKKTCCIFSVKVKDML